MTDLGKLIRLHDRTGSAKTFLLTKEELQEFINAAIAVGQDGLEALEVAAQERGFEAGRDTYECMCHGETPCDECGFRVASLCQPCAENIND